MAGVPSADLPPRVVDGRKTARKRTLLAGKVIYGEGRSVGNCSIRNLSPEGARITLPADACIPTRVFLLDPREGIAYEATVSWIRAPEFGLSFHHAHDLKKTIPEKLAYLERVWRECRSPLGSNL